MKNKVLKNIGALFLGFLSTVILTLVTDLILFKTKIMKTNPFRDNPSWLIVKWDVPPHWYGIALVLLALPCAWTGGKLFESKNKIVYHG
jgi:hypothetical protein